MSKNASSLNYPSTSRVPSSFTTKNVPKKPQEFSLPPLNVSITGKKKELNYMELKNRTIRRQAPAGEDKKALAQIIKNLKGQNITVQEFVNLVSPYTEDQGEVMRKVLEDDLPSFREMVTKVYETMTQDVSDVLVNEQLAMTHYYSERCEFFNLQILKLITEIFEMAPDFDMVKYHTNKEDHLNLILPIPITIQRDETEMEGQRRQQMFHRLQWLRFEGIRLSEENERMEKRLSELKRQQKIEQERALEAQSMVEEKKQALESEKAEKSMVLQELNESLGKSMIRSEAFSRMEEEVDIRTSMVPVVQNINNITDKPKFKKHQIKATWPSTIAEQMEQKTIDDSFATENSLLDKRRRMRRTPITTQPSSFHYSASSPEYMEEITIDQSMTTVQQPRNVGTCPTGRC